MIKSQICSNEAEIRRLITEHLPELVSEKQEVKVACRTMPIPIVGVITGYEPKVAEGESHHDYEDTLYLHPVGDTVYILDPCEITHFEVLPTRRMTNKLAYQEMKQMEHAGGVTSKA